MKKLFCCIEIILLIIFCFSCNKNDTPENIKVTETSEEMIVTETSETTVKTEITTLAPVDNIVTFTAVGDNLIHSSIYKQAKLRSTNGDYDFDYAYENVCSVIDSDINFINQETLICNDIYEPSTYPLFNSPKALGDKMIDMHFNVFNLANNHSLDMGINGANACLDYWNSRNITTCGMYRNEEDLMNIRTVKKNNITFSFLGFTDHTNGLYIPKGNDLQIVYTSNLGKIAELIEKASLQSDIVVVSVHWGVENSHEISDAQKQMALYLTDCGADIIIGTHPHVVQDIEELVTSNGNHSLVAYSLGNFISAQNVPDRLIGGILKFNIIKNSKTYEISCDNIKLYPVITHYNYGFKNLKLYTYPQYTEELAEEHGVNADYVFNIESIDKILMDNISKKYLCMK